MSSNQSEKLSEKDKIQILLQEYNTLRSELVANTGRALQMATLVGIALTLTLSRPVDKRFWIVAIIGVVGLVGLGSVVIRDVRRLGHRVIELEKDINRRAGEELLVWENRRGALATGLLFPRTSSPSYFGLSKRKKQK